MKFKRLLRERALGSIFDASCTLLQGASELRASRAKSYHTCNTLDEFELQEVELCHTFTLYTLCLKTGRFKCSPLGVTANEGGIQTTIAGGLWGAYLMPFTYFCKELAC